MRMDIATTHEIVELFKKYDCPMDTLVIMCGLPASGKSTLAKKIAEVSSHIKVFSSDDYREKFYGDANEQKNPAFIFDTLRNDAKEWVKSGNTAIIDATNIKHKDRKAYEEIKKECNCYVLGVAVLTPDYVCLKRNALRERVVPEAAILRMADNLTVPYEPYFDEVLLTKT